MRFVGCLLLWLRPSFYLPSCVVLLVVCVVVVLGRCACDLVVSVFGLLDCFVLFALFV